jgi:dUTP pyrophosphatase
MLPVKVKHVGLVRMPLPEYQTPGAAGLDLRAAIAETREIAPMETMYVPTGIALSIPAGYEGQVRPRSGLARRHGVTVLNSPGTIDSDYRGEVGIVLINHGRNPFVVEPGARIAQVVFARVERAELIVTDDLDDTTRGSGGYGSTGQ